MMKVLWEAFAAVFVAEFGDKTQLVAVTMTASTKKPWAVFLGASLAMTAVTAIGVLFGQVAARFVPPETMHRIAATAFIAIGVWMWVKP
ncbi:MAG: TMEM165/GDT1 family protein [Elusimicrobia bacterium]|nr:TMEM165/GDT1 family protein [Elusimicrobiota bacterium]